MIDNRGLTDKVDDMRSEIVYGIKQRIIDITNNESYKPVILDNVIVIDNSIASSKIINYLKIHNIFIDDNDVLCGDCVGQDNFSDGFVFGRCIEDLYIEDLQKIVKSLYGNEWNIYDDSSDIKFDEKQTSFFKRYFHIPGLVKKGA